MNNTIFSFFIGLLLLGQCDLKDHYLLKEFSFSIDEEIVDSIDKLIRVEIDSTKKGRCCMAPKRLINLSLFFLAHFY